MEQQSDFYEQLGDTNEHTEIKMNREPVIGLGLWCLMPL
jgi:hypothetical protein